MLERLHAIIFDAKKGRARTLGEIEEHMRTAGYGKAEINSVLAFAINLRESGVVEFRGKAEREGRPS